MTSQQIQYFLSAAKHLSFTKAAEEFYTSQPTISRQIAALEEELGFDLFYREGKQLRLTSGGLVMLSEFNQQQQSLQSAIQRVEQIESGFEGELNIAYLTSLDTDYYVYPPTMVFSSRHPKIAVNLDSGSFGTLRQRLENGEYDIIFTYNFELPFIPDSLSQYVYRCGCSLIASSRHPLGSKLNLSPSDFHGQTLILPAAFDSRDRLKDMERLLLRGFGCTEAEFERINLRMVDTLETKQFLVRSGVGIGITGNCMDYAYDSRYTLFPLPGETMELHAVWRKDNLNPAIPLYLQVLSETPEIDVFRSET